MNTSFTPEQTKLIWDALSEQWLQMQETVDPRARHTKAMEIVAKELRRVGTQSVSHFDESE